jgi:2-polyprenyl-3-methyl-5-hydroxy-6-metoxy-1,4-benzoquinol methylase
VKQRLASHLELDNIEFIEGSLLDVENITQGKLFDFIECTGVLHHLKDPSEGLRKLNSVLKEDGGKNDFPR